MSPEDTERLVALPIYVATFQGNKPLKLIGLTCFIPERQTPIGARIGLKFSAVLPLFI
jgi:hypothetical protein